MDDIDRAKALAALEQLEAEKDRRVQAKIDAGDLVSIPTTIVIGRGEDADAAKARALANLPTTTPDGRAIHRDLMIIVTGVPRRDPDEPDEPTPQVQASSEGTLSPPSSEPAAGELLIPHPQPTHTYVRIVTSNGSDGDPGAIAEAWWSIEDGAVVLRDADDKHITARAMLKGEDPAVLARSLLREVEKPKDFNRPISYPKMGFA
jgi:hypothetical protein